MSDEQKPYGGPAASMGLLLELLRDSGDPGYAAAAARREAEHEPPPRGRLNSVVAFVSLAVVGLLLAAAAAQTRQAAPAVQAERTALVQRVIDRTASTDAVQAEVDALRLEVAAAEDAALSSTDAGRAAAARLAEQQTAAQYTAVRGPGLEVVLEDSSAAGADPDKPELGKVLDRDIQLVVNGLWQAGAEAVTINGLRLSARSAIRAAGGAILVDYRPLRPPYRVEAIGDSAQLATRITDGGTGRALAALRDTYDIRFSVSTRDAIAMAAATSSLPELATPLRGTP